MYVSKVEKVVVDKAGRTLVILTESQDGVSRWECFDGDDYDKILKAVR